MDKSKLDKLRIERPPERRPSVRWLMVLAVLGVVAAAAAWLLLQPAAKIEVTTEPARLIQGPVPGTVLNASGYVTARRQATVSAKFTGRVEEILIEEGMEVEAGQVLARLDASNINASLRLAEARLASARTSSKETEALLTEARANYERSANLVARGLASDSELDRARALAESLAAQLERKEADVEVALRELDVYRQQLEDSIIRAPFAGIVVAKNAQPGEMISPISAGGGFTRTGIGTIVDMDSLEIEVDVNEAYINRVTAGQAVVATLDAYPDWQIPCHVIAIIPTADRQRATVEVRVGFDQLDVRILPDMGVKVAFRDSSAAEGGGRLVAVPAAAVRAEGEREVVFIARDGVAERRAVRVVERRQDEVLVSAGLSGGERVVTTASARLSDGAALREASK